MSLKEQVTDLFQKTLAFYSEATGYNFPIKPTLKTFNTHSQFREYIGQPRAINYEPVEACAGACSMIDHHGKQVILCIDLSDEDFDLSHTTSKFMAPYTFFHEYEHVRRHVTERGIIFSMGKTEKERRLKEEKEVILAAVDITEKFLGIKLPTSVRKEIEEKVEKLRSLL